MKLKFKKGLILNLEGAVPAGAQPITKTTDMCAIIPDDFPGFRPKPAVKDGDEVACGQALLFDKTHPETKILSPIAGRVKGVVRGDRRKILRVEIEAAEVSVSEPTFECPTDADSAKSFLAASGMMAFMRQRPYDIVPNPSDTPRDIFVTAADTAPLASASATYGTGIFTADDYQRGVDILRMATKGKVYLAVAESWPYGDIKGAEMLVIEGPHPAGNVSVQIEAVEPVNKGDIVWTLDGTTLARTGRIAASGKFCPDTIVAVNGPEVTVPGLVKTVIGASVDSILKGNINETPRHLRVISGNVFTGTAIGDDDKYLHFPYRQITVIDEGDDVDEFMGWASVSPSKMSQSASFPSHFFKRLFRPDARLNGGRRAMIQSGEYDKVMPMDIMPEYLIKAIMAHNIEDMEALGIYEVAPEDFAAAEYVDTSKLPLQKIVREGLDYIRKELE